jgi:peptidoglycan biosynthesis protein MviN/MurJ (putative lipid II flippase)
VNQALATALTFLFLVGIGLFNLALGISHLRKRNRSHFWGWGRVLLSLALLGVALWFSGHLMRGGPE